MAYFKKGLIFLTSMGLAVTLSACNDESNEKDKTSKATEHKNTEKNNISSSKTSNEQQSKQDDVGNLSQKTKLALAFFADDVDQYILNKDEALTGVYENKTGGESKKKQLYKLLLIKEKSVANAPEGMDFYTVYPPKGSFASVIGISEDKIFVGGTQGVIDYDEMSKSSNEYNIKDLYNKNKNYTSLSELANKLEITDKNPMADEDTRKEFEASENAGTNTHLRTQVYQMIEELDGHPIDTDKYLVDNVQTAKNGKWYVNYRNKNAEIVGTYTTKDGKVIKKDANDKIIKSKNI